MPDTPDKLQFSVEATYKFTFPDLVIKDVKQTTSTSFDKFGKVRIKIPKLADAQVITSKAIDPIQDLAKANVMLLVVKIANVDANKGIQPVLVRNEQFSTVNPANPAVKVLGDTAATFWVAKVLNTPIGLSPPANGLFHYVNPNSTDVYVDVFFGYDQA